MTYKELIEKIKDMSTERREEYAYSFYSQDLAYINPFEVIGSDYDSTMDDRLDLLEDQWSEFNLRTKPFKRRSDWIQLEFFDITNEDMYNTLKNELIDYPINNRNLCSPDNVLSESADFEPAADFVNWDALENINWSAANSESIRWQKTNGYVMIIGSNDLNELEKRWDAFNMMIKKHRRISDWACQDIYGVTNSQLYIYLKRKLIANDIEPIEPEDIDDLETDNLTIPFNELTFLRKYCKEKLVYESGCEVAQCLIRLMNEGQNNIIENIIANTISDYQDINSGDALHLNYSNMPVFTPNELVDDGIFGKENSDKIFDSELLSSDSSILEWFKRYEEVFNGLPMNEDFRKTNSERVHALEQIYAARPTVESRLDPKVSKAIFRLGWNPYYEFNEMSRSKADKRINSLIESGYGRSQIIDLRGFRVLDTDKFFLKEDSSILTKQGKAKPIYLVFEEGNSWFSKSIKTVTKGTYSHAAIAFDSSMRKMYSYGMKESKNKLGGFIVEDIRTKEKNAHMGVYAIFVAEEIWNKIYNNVMYFVRNADKTMYGFANVLANLFHVDIQFSKSMICSQFVDRMLKLGGIDVTGKKSSQVDPNYLRRCSKANKSIYRLFEARVRDFNPKKIDDKIKGLAHTISLYKSGAPIGKDVVSESMYYYDSLNALNEIWDILESTECNYRLSTIYETFYNPCMSPSIIRLDEPSKSIYELSLFDLIETEM